MMGRMTCPYLKGCFRESINRKHDFFEKDTCNKRERWSKCPVFQKKEEHKASED